MARKLTKKQRGFVKDYVETGNGTQAAMNNYDVEDEHVAAVIASENLTKPEIVKSIQEALPDELLAQVHLEGLQATRTTVIGEQTEIIDYAVRHKYLDSAYKLKGSYAAEKHINLNIEADASPEIKDLTAKLNEIYRGSGFRSDGGTASVVDTEAQDKN